MTQDLIKLNVPSSITLNSTSTNFFQQAETQIKQLAEASRKRMEDGGMLYAQQIDALEQLTQYKKNLDFHKAVTSIKQEIDQCYSNNLDNLAGFNAGVQAIREKYQNATVFEDANEQLNTLMQQSMHGYVQALTQREIRKSNVDLHHTLAVSMTEDVNRLQNGYLLAMSKDETERTAGLNLLEQAFDSLHHSLEAQNFTGSPVFMQSEKAQFKQGVNEALAQSYCRAVYNQLPTIDEKILFMQAVQSGDLKPDVMKIPGSPSFQRRVLDIDFNALSPHVRRAFAEEMRKGIDIELKRVENLAHRTYGNKVETKVVTGDRNVKAHCDSADVNYNLLCENYLGKIMQEKPEGYADVVAVEHIQFVEKWGCIPKSMFLNMKAQMRTDPNLFKAVCSIVDKIDTDYKDIIINSQDFDKEMSQAMLGSQLMHAGYSPEMAMQHINKLETLSKEEKADLRKQFREAISSYSREHTHVKGKPFNDAFHDVVVGICGEPVDIDRQPIFEQQMHAIMEEEFMRTGSFEVAKRATAQFMKNQWGPSRLNGEKELVTLPPERFYKNGDVTEEVMQDRLDNVRRLLTDANGNPIDRVYVYADAQTLKEVNIENRRSPTYPVCYFDEFGVLVPAIHMETHVPFRVGADIWRTDGDLVKSGIMDLMSQKEAIQIRKDEMEMLSRTALASAALQHKPQKKKLTEEQKAAYRDALQKGESDAHASVASKRQQIVDTVRSVRSGKHLEQD